MSIEETIKESVKSAIQEALKEVNLNKQGDGLPEVLNVKQAAQFLNVSSQWIYDNVKQLPSFECAGTKFLKSELMKWCINKTGRNFAVVRKVN